MVVIPLARGRRTRKPTFDHPLSPPAPVQGTFRAPSGQWGRMTGLVRLHRLVVKSGQLHAIAVFAGELLDADGSRVGVGSRRATVPADMARSADGISLSIGPLDVNLLGLTVGIEGFAMEMGTAKPSEASGLARVEGGA